MDSSQLLQKFNIQKVKHLLLSIIIDAFGWSSYVIPVIGETEDIAWAPISAIAIFFIYKRSPLALRLTSGGINFTEEILPGTDIIPTATFTWGYTYIFKKEDTLAAFVKSKKKEREILNSFDA